MRPEDLDVIAKIVAQKVKEGVAKARDGLDERIAALEAENKALGDLLVDVVTSDQIRAVGDTLGEHAARLDALKEGWDTSVEAITSSLDHCRMENETRSQETTALQQGLDGLRKDDGVSILEDRITKLADDITGVADSLEAKITDKSDNDVKERTVLFNRVTQLEEADLSKHVSDVLSTLWHEQYQNDVAAMIPNLDEHDLDMGKRFEQINERLDAIPDYDQIKTDIAADLPTAEQIGDALGVTAMVGQIVDDTLPAMIPEPKAIDVDVIKGNILDSLLTKLPELVKHYMPAPITPTELQIADAVKALWPDIRHSMLKYLPKMEHKGTYNPEMQYDIGDEVIQNGSTFRKMHDTEEAPPGDGWQMVALRGKTVRGKPGEPGESVKGDKGDPGRGIKESAILEGKSLVFELSDGEVHELDLTDLINEIIQRIGE